MLSVLKHAQYVQYFRGEPEDFVNADRNRRAGQPLLLILRGLRLRRRMARDVLADTAMTVGESSRQNTKI